MKTPLPLLLQKILGFALVADVAILDHFKLEKLHLSDVTLHHTVYLAYLRGHYQVPAVRNFISFIKKEGLLCEVSSLLPTNLFSDIFPGCPGIFLPFPAFLHTLQTFVPAVDGTFPSPVPYKYSVADPGYAKDNIHVQLG